MTASCGAPAPTPTQSRPRPSASCAPATSTAALASVKRPTATSTTSSRAAKAARTIPTTSSSPAGDAATTRCWCRTGPGSSKAIRVGATGCSSCTGTHSPARPEPMAALPPRAGRRTGRRRSRSVRRLGAAVDRPLEAGGDECRRHIAAGALEHGAEGVGRTAEPGGEGLGIVDGDEEGIDLVHHREERLGLGHVLPAEAVEYLPTELAGGFGEAVEVGGSLHAEASGVGRRLVGDVGEGEVRFHVLLLGVVEEAGEAD